MFFFRITHDGKKRTSQMVMEDTKDMSTQLNVRDECTDENDGVMIFAGFICRIDWLK
jgi:hypothetical protein